MKNTHLTTALVLVLLLAALPAAATELPAQAMRIWAPAGDLISLDNHATASLVMADRHGDRAKGAEDTQLYGKTMGTGLFGYHRTSDSSHQIDASGYFGNLEGGGLSGDFGVWSSAPGTYGATLTYHRHHTYSDTDSEMRNPNFPYPPPPASLDFEPRLRWAQGKLDLRFHLSDSFDLTGGVVDMRREGRKGSLLRGGALDTPPGVQTMDTSLYEVWVGGAMALGRFTGDLRLAFRGSDGDREHSTGHFYSDDRQDFRGSLDVAYDVNARHRLQFYGLVGDLTSKGSETWGASDGGNLDNESHIATGRLAWLGRLSRHTMVRLSGGLSSQDTDGNLSDPDGVLLGSDRQRDYVDAMAAVDNTSFGKTRIHLHYKYRQTDLTEVTAEGALPGEVAATRSRSLDQKKRNQEVALRIRSRLSRQAKLRVGLRYQDRNVEHAVSDNDWYGVMGDYQRQRLGWELALQTRPSPKLPLDFGYQGRDQSLERKDQNTETTWQAHRLFANLNWLASPMLSVYGMVSYGTETYELKDGPAPTPGMGAFDYDGTTLRFTPGATVRLTPKLSLEAMYEGIYFEDKGNESTSLNPVESDHDRAMVRARWQASEKLTVSATYRRNAFDENRWDDYIQDLYAISLSGLF